MRTAVRKLLIVSVACIMAIGMTLGLAACGNSGPSDEEIITGEIDEMMAALQDPTSEESKELLGDFDAEDMAVFEEYGLDPYEFLGQCFSRVDYTIDAVNVDGSNATADLTITNVNLDAAMDAAASEFEMFVETDEAVTLYGTGGMSGLMGKFMEFFYAQIASSEDMVQTPCTLTFTKNGDVWEVGDEGVEAFASAMYGGLDISDL